MITMFDIQNQTPGGRTATGGGYPTLSPGQIKKERVNMLELAQNTKTDYRSSLQEELELCDWLMPLSKTKQDYDRLCVIKQRLKQMIKDTQEGEGL